jgi:tetratricopeptide (TPR) repeat protein
LLLINLALTILLLGLTPYPRAFTGAMQRAVAQQTAREYGAALDSYKQAARYDADSPLPWLAIGRVLLEQNRPVQAAIAFQEAEHLGSGLPALVGLGESYAKRGDWAAAMQTWMEALVTAQDDAGLLVSLGRGSVAQDHFDQAAGFLQRALVLEPEDDAAIEAHQLLGRLLVASDPAAAAEHFRQAGDGDMLAVLEGAQAEANETRRALLLGAAFLQRDELALARRHFARAIDLAPDEAEAYAYLAHVYDLMGETVQARLLLEQALTLDPESALVHYFWGTHEHLVGNLYRARDAMWEALLRDPENAAMRLEMAEIFLDLHDYAAAEEWYQGAVEVAPENLEFHLLLANFYTSSLYHVAEGGIPAAQAAVDLAPEDARAYDLLGWAYHLAGRHAEAQRAFLRSLALDPDLPSAHYHLGSMYLSIGQQDRAREHLQRASDLDTNGFLRRRAELLLLELE